MNHWVVLGIAILCEVIGTSALKATDNFTKLWPSLAVVLAYGASFFFLSMTLKTIPVGIAYAIWSGVGLTLICVASWLIYGQKLDVPAIVGMVLIVSGVIVMNLFSKSVSH